jgi:hypothetical protein
MVGFHVAEAFGRNGSRAFSFSKIIFSLGWWQLSG